jgi:glycosyltransferase involved in cell wall biosynthesis
MAEATVCVVPLRAGSGTRLKIFEALAMGKAVVSTTVGAEGLDIDSGDQFVAADGAQDFARAVIDLLKDPSRRQRVGDAGRALVEHRYSWAQVARPFELHCQSAVEAHVNLRTATGRRPHLSPAGSAR